MLCNKSDIEDAKDEVHIVNTLQVERLVNEARYEHNVKLIFLLLLLDYKAIGSSSSAELIGGGGSNCGTFLQSQSTFD